MFVFLRKSFVTFIRFFKWSFTNNGGPGLRQRSPIPACTRGLPGVYHLPMIVIFTCSPW